MRDIYLKDYGITPADDSTLTERLAGVLSLLREEKDIALHFEPGTYHFYPDNAPEKLLYIANHDADANKRIGLDLSGFRGLTLDGAGSELIFHTEILPFYLENCVNVRLKRFQIDYARPVCSEGKIVSVSPKVTELDIDPRQYPWAVENETLVFQGENFRHALTHWLEIDQRTNAPRCGCADLYFVEHAGPEKRVRAQAVRISSHRVQLRLTGNDAFFAASRAGDTLILRHHPRSHPGFYVLDSVNIRLEQIKVYHAAGMAFLAERTKDIRLSHLDVCRRPNAGRVFTAIADAAHFVNCEGRIEIKSCLFENQLDDAVNVHGIYGVIRRKKECGALEFTLAHEMQQGVYIGRAGQTIAILEKGTLQPVFTTKIQTITRKTPSLFELTTEQTLPEDVTEGDILENLTQKPDVRMENCILRHNRARGVLLTCRTAEVRNCRFETAGAAVLLAGDTRNGFESGAITHVELSRNEFLDCAYIPDWGRAPIQVTPSAGFVPQKFYHGQLALRENRFCLIDDRLLYARNIAVIQMENNHLKHSATYPPTAGKAYDLEQVGECKRLYTCL